jgi:TolB protein
MQQLTTGAGQDVELALAPDDRRIAFAILKINADVWKLPVSPLTGKAEGEPVSVISTTREDSRGAWSADGSKIAYNSDRTGEMSIWICTSADGSTRQLTKGAGGDFQPDWSPDGKRVVFFSTRSGNTDIWTADADTGALTELTSGPSLEINPFYSPDGKSIAYQSDASGRLELWVMDADGAHQRKLTSKEITGHFMRWTKDGSAVLFRTTEPPQPGVWSAPLEGGGEAHFVLVPKGGSHMSFSPASDRVMDVVLHTELWVSPLSGADPERVYQFADPDIRIDYPVWSPDGHWILFDRVKSQGGDIWTLEIKR